MGDFCQQCGNEYQRIGTHWSHPNSSCSHPSFTDHQQEIITGLLMGDGSIDNSRKNPRIETQMISPNYLEYIADEFGVLGSEVSLAMTAAENAKAKRDSGFSPNANAENYSDVYRWCSMSHVVVKKCGLLR